MKRIFLLCLFTILLQNVQAQYFELVGCAPDFANQQLPVLTIVNPILNTSDTIATVQLAADGTFCAQISIPEHTWIQLPNGVYNSILFAEPGKSYTVQLPPFSKKTEADIRNPFFKLYDFHLSVLVEKDLASEITSPSNLNYEIYSFDTSLDKINKDLLISTSKNQSFDTDARIEEIEKSFDSSSSEYFSTYRKMRYGLLKINSKDTRLKFILTNYLGPGPPRIDDPAYMDLFTQMYKDFLFYYSRSEEGKNIPHIINRLHSLNILQDSLLKHDAVNSIAMAQLILLQNISENYSKGYFYKEALELLLDSISEQAVLPEYKVIADELKQHLTRLKIGTYPPELNLLSQNDEWKTMADFNGKYVYLNFCTPDNYSCMSEYPFMRALHRAHQHHLEFVTVLICNTHDEMKNFISSNQYKWSFLFYGNNDKLLKDYEVMAYPTSYLLDKEGRIIQSPAALPTEGLEQQLFHIMRARGDL